MRTDLLLRTVLMVMRVDLLTRTEVEDEDEQSFLGATLLAWPGT
jgi:hypothetical protein